MQSLVSSATATAHLAHELQFIFYIDEDDEESLKKAEWMKDLFNLTIDFVVGPRIVLSEMWNQTYELAHHDVLMHCGDDILFRSNNWDKLVVDTFQNYKDNILFVHGRDGYHDERFGTHGFIHRDWVETVGYFVPPYFSSDFNDTWLNDVANELGRRRFLNDVYTEHCHYVFGKAERDQTHIDREARGARDGVKELYESPGMVLKRSEDVEKLRGRINGKSA